jgi:hypothetical protein
LTRLEEELRARVGGEVRFAAGYLTGASVVVDGGMLLMGPQASERLTDDTWRRP